MHRFPITSLIHTGCVVHLMNVLCVCVCVCMHRFPTYVYVFVCMCSFPIACTYVYVFVCMHSFPTARTYVRVWCTVELTLVVRSVTWLAAVTCWLLRRVDWLTWWREDALESTMSGNVLNQSAGWLSYSASTLELHMQSQCHDWYNKIVQCLWAWFSWPIKSANKIGEPCYAAGFIICIFVTFVWCRLHNYSTLYKNNGRSQRWHTYVFWLTN